MRPEERDAAILWDMLQSARDATGIVAGATAESLRRDRLRTLALERSMELLGEAAGRVSATFRAAHPQVPWRAMIGLRNILAHEYGRIDHERLFMTAVKELPALITQLERFLSAPKPR
ncbi:MAG: DUF86 domain-containing protein [Betaproteobacteria bacterium]|nr:DUF86 domain-containing protein [Betaproteobacteria bacterium]